MLLDCYKIKDRKTILYADGVRKLRQREYDESGKTLFYRFFNVPCMVNNLVEQVHSLQGYEKRKQELIPFRLLV
jgi:hypothetical protein